MSAPPEQHDDGDLALDPEERKLGERVRATRAVPSVQFRGALGRSLAARDPGYGPRPERLRLLVTAFTTTGGGLLLLGALQALGQL